MNITGVDVFINCTFPSLTGYAYYGEYPLAFAACFGREEVYDYLLDHGADPNLRDTFGNTVLHMMVITNQIVSVFHREP